MKVLHVVSSLPSAEKPYNKPFVLSQIESLRKHSIEIDVMNLMGTENTINYFIGIFKILNKMRKKKYDLIHAHYSYCGWSSIFQNRIPVVLSLMGSDLYGVPDGKGGQTLKGFINIISTKVLIKMVDTVIVKSKSMRKMVSRKDNVFIVPNGVDFDKFKPIQKIRDTKSSDVSKKRVFFLGNPSLPRKNLSLAQKAIEIVGMKNPDVELLTTFGVSQDKVVEFMNSSDLLLLTSLLEGSPNVIKEAMACNLPIVSTDVGDVREVIGDTEGCYITSFEPEDVAEKIQEALDFGKRTNGRENIRHLEINNISKKIIFIYAQTLNRN